MTTNKRKLSSYPTTLSPRASYMSDQPGIDEKNVQASVCTKELVPGKLHNMLDYADSQGLGHSMSWTIDGRAFVIHDTEKPVDILPLFFSQTTSLEVFTVR
jgi:hypothetical protein